MRPPPSRLRRLEKGTMSSTLHVFQDDESGETLVEYGLLVAGVCLAALVAVHALGASLVRLFDPSQANRWPN